MSEDAGSLLHKVVNATLESNSILCSLSLQHKTLGKMVCLCYACRINSCLHKVAYYTVNMYSSLSPLLLVANCVTLNSC